MIYDELVYFSNYTGLHPLFKQVAEYITQNDLSLLPEGRYELGNGITLGVNEYMTRSVQESFIECHRKYIDIQVLGFGNEKVGVCSLNRSEQMEYQVDKDFQKLNAEVSFLTLLPGQFMVFFPQDGHMPMLMASGIPERVKKLVFKIPV